RFQAPFQRLHVQAHRGLTHAQDPCSGRETAQLGGLGECLQMRQEFFTHGNIVRQDSRSKRRNFEIRKRRSPAALESLRLRTSCGYGQEWNPVLRIKAKKKRRGKRASASVESLGRSRTLTS